MSEGLRAEDVKEALAPPKGSMTRRLEAERRRIVETAAHAWLASQEQTPDQIWWCAAERFAHSSVPDAPWGVHECASEFGCGWMRLVPAAALVRAAARAWGNPDYEAAAAALPESLADDVPQSPGEFVLLTEYERELIAKAVVDAALVGFHPQPKETKDGAGTCGCRSGR